MDKKSEIRKNIFLNAIKDYLFLINKGYPNDSSHKLISDFYRLNNLEREVLKRGICKKEIIKERKRKTISNAIYLKGKILYIDLFNILLTLHSFLTGKFVFISMDGFLRDVSMIGGNSIHKIDCEKYIICILRSLCRIKPSKVIFLMDEPVSFSLLMKENFEKIFEKFKINLKNKYKFSETFKNLKLQGTNRLNIYLKILLDKILLNKIVSNFDLINFEFKIVKNVDKFIINIFEKNSIIVTSDSYIIDKSQLKFFDLSKYIIKNLFRKKFTLLENNFYNINLSKIYIKGVL